MRRYLASALNPVLANGALRQAVERLSSVDDNPPGRRDRREALEAAPRCRNAHKALRSRCWAPTLRAGSPLSTSGGAATTLRSGMDGECRHRLCWDLENQLSMPGAAFVLWTGESPTLTQVERSAFDPVYAR